MSIGEAARTRARDGWNGAALWISRYVHEYSAKLEEISRAQRLGEEVSVVVCCADVGNGELSVFDEFADPQVSPVDVFGAVMVLRVVREVTCGLVVSGLSRGAGGWETELGDEVADGDSVLCSGGGGDDFGLAA